MRSLDAAQRAASSRRGALQSRGPACLRFKEIGVPVLRCTAKCALHRARDTRVRHMTSFLTRTAIVAEARAWIGTRYRHQASVKGVGCDCLGLVRGVWRGCVGDEPEAPPPYAPDWAEATGEESLANAALRHLIPVARENFAAGDVLLFRWRDGYVAKHVAIAASEASMIHAHDGASVCEVAIAPWWRRRLAYAFRFPGVAD
jgi:NlpC/P60 family putative phage cell wall peptidase